MRWPAGGGVRVMVGVEVGPPGVTVMVAVGCAPQGLNVELLLRGVGGLETAKSEALLSVSVQPPLRRKSLLVFAGAGAGPVPSKSVAVVPKPTKSTTFALP